MSFFVRLVAASAVLVCAVGGAANAQNFSLNPTYGTVNLTAGFTPDPQVVAVQSGGAINAGTLSSSCANHFIANAPDVRLNYTAGSYPLIISANSSADTTLVVNSSNGVWFCDDDSGNGLNPMVRFNNPGSGQYDIWIGTFNSASLHAAQLHISEKASQ